MAETQGSVSQGIGDFISGKLQGLSCPEGINRSGLAYTDKVAMVTGGSMGIGRGCAEVFVDAGAHVMIADIAEEEAAATAREFGQRGPGKCAYQACDVSDPDALSAAIEKTVEHYGQLDCIINNAGFHPGFRPIDDYRLEDLSKLFATNFFSQFVGCQKALPHLRKTKGNIINMSSITASLGQDGAAIYAATKGATSAFTKSLAIEEARHGVRVNAVLPGNIYTQSRVTNIAAMGERGVEMDRVCDQNQHFGRSGTPQEAGQVCLFLASDAASFLTGLELYVSAGLEIGFGIKYPPFLLPQ